MSFVNVKDFNAFKEFSVCNFLDNRNDLIGRNAVFDKKRKVAADCGIFRKCFEFTMIDGVCEKFDKVDFRNVNARVDVVGFLNVGINLADVTDQLVPDKDFCASAFVQIRFIHAGVGRFVDFERRENAVEQPFERKEIVIRAVHTDAQSFGLDGEIFKR